MRIVKPFPPENGKDYEFLVELPDESRQRENKQFCLQNLHSQLVKCLQDHDIAMSELLSGTRETEQLLEASEVNKLSASTAEARAIFNQSQKHKTTR